MGENFLGEIKLIGFTFAPKNWAECKGQVLAINQNQSLYALLGTTFGGTGQTGFNLPDLRGRVPVHPGLGISQGQTGGVETCTLTEDHMPKHTHSFYANDASATEFGIGAAADRFLAQPEEIGIPLYGEGGPDDMVELDTAGMKPVGDGQPHTNMQPSLVIRYAIAMHGIFPSRS